MDQATSADQGVPQYLGNAVKTQIWIAVIVYLIVAIVKKRLHLPGSLHTLLQIMEVNLFEKTDIIQVVEKAMRQETTP